MKIKIKEISNINKFFMFQMIELLKEHMLDADELYIRLNYLENLLKASN